MRQSLTPLLHLFKDRTRTAPEPWGNPETYAEEFPATARAFRAFLARAPRPARHSSPQPVGIVVTPWVRTPTPWYALALALALAARGRAIRLIWDDIPFPAPGEIVEMQNRAIRAMCARLPAFEIVRLSNFPRAALSSADREHVDRLAEQNLIWHLRGAAANDAHLELHEQMRASLGESLARASSLFASKPFSYVVQCGGVFGGSSSILRAGRQAGVRVATYDANFGVIQVATEGIAAQQTDIPRAFQAALAWDAGTRDRALDQARTELEARAHGRDQARYQLVAPQTHVPFPVDVLMPLNVEFDSASLGRHIVFQGTREWVTSTADFILRESNASVVIRQHPSERRRHERGLFDLASALERQFPNEPRIRYVAAEEPINTYDLVAHAGLVLPFASTIGYEAVAMGKPVLVAGSSCYSDLGFVHKPTSRAEFFDVLRSGLKGQLEVTAAQREQALLCYYLTPVCARVWTDFTAQPPDFWKWVKREPLQLFAEPEVADILSALDENVPMALVRHARKTGSSYT